MINFRQNIRSNYSKVLESDHGKAENRRVANLEKWESQGKRSTIKWPPLRGVHWVLNIIELRHFSGTWLKN